MRSTPGESDAPVTPNAASRGQKPASHGSQWKEARSIVSGPRNAGDGLGPAVDVARGRAASGARRRRVDVVRGVGVDPLLDGAGRHAPRLAARGGFDRLEVPALDGAGAYERVDLGDVTLVSCARWHGVP
jgi:hypothetical protein